jgi:hypothetical protein
VIPPETLDQPRITSFQGGQDGLVFPKAAIHVTGDVQRSNATGHAAGIQFEQESGKHPVPARLENNPMPLRVGGQPGFCINALGVLGHLCLQAPKLLHISRCKTWTGQMGGQAFESAADNKKLP